MLKEFGVPHRLAPTAGIALPLAELGIACALLVPAVTWWGAACAVCLLLVFAAALAVQLSRGRAPRCNCFGQLHSSDTSWSTIARDVGLAAVAAGALLAGPSGRQLDPFGWFGGLRTAEQVLVLALAALAVVVFVQAWFLLELFRQHGRLLARLSGTPAGGRAGQRPSQTASSANGTDLLRIGSPAPDFHLKSVDGALWTLPSLLEAGEPLVLVFSDPDCGPCQALTPLLGVWQAEYEGALSLVLISRDRRESRPAKAEEEATVVVLLQRDREVADAYGAAGTPAAIVVTRDGHIGSGVVYGADAIRDLLALAVTAATGSAETVLDIVGERPRSGGLPGSAAASPFQSLGAPMPSLTWLDLDGRRLSSASLGSGSTTFLFWNPSCGFCRALTPQIVAWERDHSADDNRLMVISSGTPEDNRALGLRSPVIVEQDNLTSRLFGAPGTPSAVRFVDGRLESELVLGGPAVLDLLAEGVHAQLS